MATTGDIPEIGFTQEISQTTYAEIISAKKSAPIKVYRPSQPIYGGSFCTADTDGTFPYVTNPTDMVERDIPEQHIQSPIYEPPANKCLIKDIYCSLEWVGAISQSTSIFGMFMRFTVRQTPTQRVIINKAPIEAKRFLVPDLAYSYYWKGTYTDELSNDNLLRSINERIPESVMRAINEGDRFECRQRAYITTTTPETNVGAANDIVNYYFGNAPNPAIGMLESISIMVLIKTDDSEQYIWQDVPYALGGGFDDESDSLRVTLQFDRGNTTVVVRNAITTEHFYNNSTDSLAEWSDVGKFDIDTLSETGISQISIQESTDPIRGIGKILTLDQTGSLINAPIPVPELYCEGYVTVGEPCEAGVTVTSRSESQIVNEIQSIIIPFATSGTFTLSFEGETTGPISYSASSGDVQTALEGLSTIGSNNVTVSGNGSTSSPYLVTFRFALGSTDQPLIIADSSLLKGQASAVVGTTTQGTFNEKTRLSTTNYLQTFNMTFEGETTSTLFRPSLNELEDALQALETIGVGNVSVTAPTPIDRNAHYNGPWDIAFVNLFGGQNIPGEEDQSPSLSVSPSSVYTLTTLAQGGGTSEIQTLKFYYAEDGYIYLVYNGNQSQRIDFPTDAATIQQAIENMPGIGIGNVTVEFIVDKYYITFDNDLIGSDIPQISAVTNNLTGGQIFIAEIVKGASPGSTIRVLNLNNANSGSFSISYGGYSGGALVYNCTADDVKSAILFAASQNSNLDLLSSDFTVDGDTGDEAVASGPFTIEFAEGYFAAELSAQSIDLACSTKMPNAIPEGPYVYDQSYDIELGLPDDGISYNDSEPSESTPIVIQRDLYDPNTLVNGRAITIRDMMLNKNLHPSSYASYYRNGSSLEAASINDVLLPGVSILAISNDIDTQSWRNYIIRHLNKSRHILPMRMVWPT